MDSSTPLCVVCGLLLPQPSKRRTLYPPVAANDEARGFFLKFVVNAPLSRIFQDGSRPDYACKPCFAKLERGSRQYSTTVSLISELRVAVRAAGKIEVAVSDPFCLPVTQASHGTQTESPQETRKRPRESGDVESTPKRPWIATDMEQTLQQLDPLSVPERGIVDPSLPWS